MTTRSIPVIVRTVKPHAIRMTLAERAQAALAEEERPSHADACSERKLQGEVARRKLTELLGVQPEEIGATDRLSVVDVERLRFTAFYDGELVHGEFRCYYALRLLYACPSCGQVERMSDPIRSLADLGRAMRETKRDLCWRCAGRNLAGEQERRWPK